MEEWREELKKHTWEEGKVITLPRGSYRNRPAITCYKNGRQRAEFANGEFPYGAYIELVRPDGTWISHGTNIVPVLPDGRLIMVVEQRPPQGRYSQPNHFIVDGKEVPFAKFGFYSSLEFPGGAIDNDHNFTAGFLRELEEETGVELRGTLYRCLQPYYPMGSDVAGEMHRAVIYLQGMKFKPFVENDGGLYIFALTEHEVQINIWQGNIRSGQAALLGWAFYQEVRLMRAHGISGLTSSFVGVEEVSVKK